MMMEIDSAAREYLIQNAKSEVECAGDLVNPMVLLGENADEGNFTVFYSGNGDSTETEFGVEFRNYVPFDLTIGD